jgi:hypothetical protein
VETTIIQIPEDQMMETIHKASNGLEMRFPVHTIQSIGFMYYFMNGFLRNYFNFSIKVGYDGHKFTGLDKNWMDLVHREIRFILLYYLNSAVTKLINFQVFSGILKDRGA